MIGSYTCDKVNIVSYAYDEWGSSTRSVVSNVDARIEDFNKLVTNEEGKEVFGNSVIFLENGATINYNDRIQLVKRAGEAVVNSSKEFDIIRLGRVHNFSTSHWEVII